MKKGKTAKIQGFKNAKVVYGTVDSFEFKSVYLTIQTWVEPIKDSENWQRIILNMNRLIKHIVLDAINNELFEDKFIVDLDLRHSGLNIGKKSFSNLEVTFFIKEKIDFKSKELKDELRRITSILLQENYIGKEYFNFYLKKNAA